VVTGEAMAPKKSQIDKLIAKFCSRFSDVIKFLETCEVDAADDVDVLSVFYNSVENYMVSLIYSRGVKYHVDTGYATAHGVRHCHMFVLRNPGYIFKRRLAKGQIEAHEKPFFSFDLTKSHGLFWNRSRLPKSKRNNWVGLSIDSKKPLDEAQCCAILRKVMAMSLDDFFCKRWFFNRMQIGGV
jgi:hypothetical protein